jgi:hypothetical protein
LKEREAEQEKRVLAEFLRDSKQKQLDLRDQSPIRVASSNSMEHQIKQNKSIFLKPSSYLQNLERELSSFSPFSKEKQSVNMRVED